MVKKPIFYAEAETRFPRFSNFVNNNNNSPGTNGINKELKLVYDF